MVRFGSKDASHSNAIEHSVDVPRVQGNELPHSFQGNRMESDAVLASASVVSNR